ncbi:MAG: acyl-CoA thioesterase [Candidatus Neomarinimicrobiota bacterium]|nr:MAG: acyl-CoA thioesterase [Candidatus Neomarinimicrobiota bacterium]
MARSDIHRSLFSHWVPVRSHWRDMDGLRHINHAAFLTYMETARLDFYHELGFDYHRWDLETSTILVGMKVNYRKQASHPTEFEVGTRLTRIGRTSFDLLTAVFPTGEESPVVDALFTLVTYNFSRQEKVPVPETFQAKLQPLDTQTLV